MLRKPQFWGIQVVAFSIGGLMACAAWPKGDYWTPVFFGLAISACLTTLMTLDK